MEQKQEKFNLTPTGLLMEGDYTLCPAKRDFECYGDFPANDKRRTPQSYKLTYLCLRLCLPEAKICVAMQPSEYATEV